MIGFKSGSFGVGIDHSVNCTINNEAYFGAGAMVWWLKEDTQNLEGYDFKSRRQILDGHVFTLICCKSCTAWLKRQKINKKRQIIANFFNL